MPPTWQSAVATHTTPGWCWDHCSTLSPVVQATCLLMVPATPEGSAGPQSLQTLPNLGLWGHGAPSEQNVPLQSLLEAEFPNLAFTEKHTRRRKLWFPPKAD